MFYIIENFDKFSIFFGGIVLGNSQTVEALEINDNSSSYISCAKPTMEYEISTNFDDISETTALDIAMECHNQRSSVAMIQFIIIVYLAVE